MKHHILVVDDETSIRASLKMILQHAGFRFTEAATGQEGLEKIAADEPDVAILDVKMPGMDGLEVLEALKRQGRDMPIIVISGHGDIDTAVRAVKLGAFNFVEKPFGEERVLVEIRNALEQRRLRQRAESMELEYDRQFEIVGSSTAMQQLRSLIQKAAPTQATVLITGESGTGKELVARAIHRNSDRRDGPFIRVNCAAIPEELIESELFGHERGSFTGATAKQIGKFLQADHGTIFLDEIGDMSARTQAKVLRALETGEIEPVGAAKVITVDVRVIAATNKDLLAEIRRGAFREDLYFRLRVLPIECPPLRARRMDIAELVDRFAAGTPHRFTPQALEALSRLPWKGNVRELRNIVERLLIMAPREQITAEDLPAELKPAIDRNEQGSLGRESSEPADSLAARTAALVSSRVSLKDFKEATEREFILAMLDRNDWNISQTAKEIDTPRSNLYKKLEQYGISKDKIQQEE